MNGSLAKINDRVLKSETAAADRSLRKVLVSVNWVELQINIQWSGLNLIVFYGVWLQAYNIKSNIEFPKVFIAVMWWGAARTDATINRNHLLY